MSLFIGTLAVDDPAQQAAVRLGVLSGFSGDAVLRRHGSAGGKGG